MSFWGTVYELRESGLIPRSWKRSDIRPHLTGKFSENTIRAVPSNASISPSHKGIGDYVKAGQTPRAWRVGSSGSGEFRLVVDPEDDEDTQDRELKKARRRAEALRSPSVPRELKSELPDLVQESTRLRHIRPHDPTIPIEEREFRMTGPRSDIARRFAEWTAMSALRSGCPIKSREEVGVALKAVDFNRLFDKGYGPIDNDQFTRWHRDAIGELLKLEFRRRRPEEEPRKLSVGWSAKIIAVYLKTRCYLSGFGRDGLSRVIHPPIDNDLIESLKTQFRSEPEIKRGLDRFDTISRMNFGDYEAIIRSCELVAQIDGCTLFEVELYWNR